MNNRYKLLSLLLFVAFSLQATVVNVTKYRYAGPFSVQKPIITDSLNVNGKPFDAKNLVKSKIDADRAFKQSQEIEADSTNAITLSKPEKGYAIHLFSFFLNSDRYVKGELNIESKGEVEVFVNNKSVGKKSSLTLEPRRYEVIIKYLTQESDTCAHTLKASFTTKDAADVVASLNPEKRYDLRTMMHGLNFAGVSMSPDGKNAFVRYTNRFEGGKSERYSQLINVADNRVRLQGNGFLNDSRWMPKTNAFFYTRTGFNGKELVIVDAQSLQENVLVNSLPEGSFYFSPDEKYLFFSNKEEGPKEDKDVYRLTEPSDRLPGFRNRYFIWRYEISSGLYEQITYGHNSTSLNDISPDSRYLLFSTNERVYTSLPHSRNSLYKLDLQTMEVDTLWKGAKYLGSATFSPNGKQLLVSGSAPAFDGMGLNIKEGQIANTYDAQLFIYDLDTRKAKALTKDFEPSVSGAIWNYADNNIYALTTDEDYENLYVIDPVSGKATKIDAGEDVISTFTVADSAPVMFYYGQSSLNASRLYSYNIRTKKRTLVNDLSAEKLKDVNIGEVKDWNFVSADGSTIQGRYYLPPNFDPTKKYPMIVYYYGGTTPTNRMLERRYSLPVFAALGYVVYTLNPSGTIGYGQEFSARHVNAWGKVTADEIIQGTKQFCEEHSFVDIEKIGCIGASYGGFMTQYLQTKTDLFAAAISHAGISALSSYWGEGYWGYGYCSIANTNTYPWNDSDFFVKQSPLFSADKINTPLLLLHGSSDTNVPVGESIQMYNALKLLGKTVEFVQVKDEDHHILKYENRIKWENSIYAWFAKWLKGQPEWWETLYPERTL